MIYFKLWQSHAASKNVVCSFGTSDFITKNDFQRISRSNVDGRNKRCQNVRSDALTLHYYTIYLNIQINPQIFWTSWHLWIKKEIDFSTSLLRAFCRNTSDSESESTTFHLFELRHVDATVSTRANLTKAVFLGFRNLAPNRWDIRYPIN